MKIVILSYADTAGWYLATLQERGHKTSIISGAILNPDFIKRFAGYDGCLLLGDEAELIEFADHLEAMGKTVWRQLADIPS